MKALHEIAEVFVGQSFKGKATTDNSSAIVKLVQLPDVRGYAVTNYESLEYANLLEKKPRIFLQKGDLLFTLKGSRMHAALFLIEEHDQITTLNHIAIIRPSKEVCSDYLLWFLNSPVAKEELKNMQSGSTIPSITKSRLIELKIPIVPFSQQMLIGKAYKNWKEQQVTLNKLLESGEQRMNAFCSTMLLGEY